METQTIEQATQRLDTTTESLKLIKNTKNYNWEIKILSTDLDRLEQLNNDMINRFGGLIQNE